MATTIPPLDAKTERQPRRAVMIVARRLDDLRTGSGQYLRTYLVLCRSQSIATTLVFAPQRSFGNLAWARVHPDIAALADQIDWAQSTRVGPLFISTSPKVWARFGMRTAEEVIRRLRDKRHIAYPSKLGEELSTAEACATIARAKRVRPTLVTAEYSSLAPLLSSFPQARRLVLLHDLFSLRAASFRARGLEPDHVSLSAEEEVRRCMNAQIILHASCTENDIFKRDLPNANHVWMHPTARQLDPPEDRSTDVYAVFVGSKHAGNTEALTYLRAQVWPEVRRQLPNAQLHIIGAIAETIDPSTAKADGLRLIGPVSNLASVISVNAIGLAPMEAGSGISIKIVDYLGLGLPVVATDTTIAAFGDVLDGIVAGAESPQRFAEHIIKLLKNDKLRKTAASNAQNVHKRLNNAELVALLAG